MKRLKTLFLCNNRLCRLAKGLHSSLPELHTVILTNNLFTRFDDLEPLTEIGTLRTLCLLDNGITRQPNYRARVICMLPKLRVLDFQKVKPAEREAAAATMAKAEAEAASGANTFTPGEGMAVDGNGSKRKRDDDDEATITPAMIEKVKLAIAGASSLDAMNKLEDALKSGEAAVVQKALVDAGVA